MYFYFTDHWKLISRRINPAIPLFIHSIRNMLFSFSSGSRMYRMIQTPLPALYFHRIWQIPLFKRFALNLNFVKAKRAAHTNICCHPPPLHRRKPTVGRTSFTSKCDWPWVSDNSAPLNFKKKKKEKCSETKQQQKKRKGKKKRETDIYNIFGTNSGT